MSHVVPLGSRSGPAVAHLFQCPTFRHHPQASRALTSDQDGNLFLDRGVLAEPWSWSSGEWILIHLAIALSSREPFDLYELRHLDDEHRRYAVEAIALSLGVAS